MTTAGPRRGAGGRVRLVVDGMYLSEPADARAVVWDGDRIVWVGADPDAGPPAQHTLHLPGAWATPGFVDAHVHATATRLKLAGIDLSSAGGAGDVVRLVGQFATSHQDDPVLGSGWDDHAWSVSALPSAEALSAAAPGRRVLLDRVDGHSCLVDAETLRAVAGDDHDTDRDPDGRATGWLREAAAGRARAHVWSRLSATRLHRARDAAAAHAAAAGVTSLHEMGNPALGTLDDAVAWARGDWPVEVLVWWADIDPAVALARGLRPGGDLFLDGAIGSRTAAIAAGYRDGPALGGLMHSDDEVAEFFVRCTRAMVGGGVHAIGDDAIEQAVQGIERAAGEVGAAAVAACRHRIEHVELPRVDHPRRMAALGVVASMQPAFDDEWGGPDRLYARRFGPQVAAATNPVQRARGCRLPAGVRFGLDGDPHRAMAGRDGGHRTSRRPWHRRANRVDGRDAWGPVRRTPGHRRDGADRCSCGPRRLGR